MATTKLVVEPKLVLIVQDIMIVRLVAQQKLVEMKEKEIALPKMVATKGMIANLILVVTSK